MHASYTCRTSTTRMRVMLCCLCIKGEPSLICNNAELKQQATCYAELLETTGNMLLAVTRNCIPETTSRQHDTKQQATCYAELKQRATKGNNWNWKERYKLDKIAKLIKRAFFANYGQLIFKWLNHGRSAPA